MQEGLKIKNKPDLMDHNVGKRLRERRIMLGLTQQDLGDAVNVTLQQIQKYEKGKNRIASGKLYSLAALLKAPITYFFEESRGFNLASRLAEDQAVPSSPKDETQEKELITLIRSYNRICDCNLRKKVLDFVKAISGNKAEYSIN